MNANRRTLTAALLGLTLVLGAGGAAYAGHFGKGHGHCRAGGPAAAVMQLQDLTDEQRDSLEALHDARADALYALRKEARADRRALRRAMRDGADLETIRPLAEKMGQHRTAMILWRAESRAAVAEVLTEEQRQELAELRRERRGHGFHHRRHGW
jgi:Spy/CpxP family protein refolding chaperone